MLPLSDQVSMAVPMALCWAILAVSLNEIIVPVDNLENWTEVAYRGIPPNSITIENGAIRIDVDRSSSPLIYGFDEPLPLTGFTVEASWRGRLDIPADTTQGNDGADDFVLKFGIVVAGDRTLSWFQRLVAADWILRLYELAPEDSGLKNIHFFSTTQQSELVGSSRRHPLSELFYEERVVHLDGNGPFELNKLFDEPVTVLGLWISSDGDDTGSDFAVRIHSIALTVAD
jgi:hypothetical protein